MFYSYYQVQILEASERVGGRVYTYVDDKNGWYGELGAMRFPSSDILLNLFIEKFNLPMNTFNEYNPNTYYYVNNVLVKTKDAEKNISLLNFNLTAEELALNSPDKIYDEAIQPILHDAAQHGWAYTVNKYGHFNIKTYLDQSGISPGAVRMIGVILNEEELFSTSMLESIRDSLTINDLPVFREFVGGTHKLLDPFLEELKDNILLHSKIVAIKQDNGTAKDVDNTLPGRPSTPAAPTTEIKQDFDNDFNGDIFGRIQQSLNTDTAGSIRPIEKLTTKNNGRQNGGRVNQPGNTIHSRPSPTLRGRVNHPGNTIHSRPSPTFRGRVNHPGNTIHSRPSPTFRGRVNYPGNTIHSRPSPISRPVAETVKQSNGKVTVEYVDNSSPDNPSTKRKNVTGDYCIMTTTAKASLLMEYDPPLSQNKRSALYDLHYDQSTKIFLYFSEAFWIKEGIVGGKSITDGFSRFIYYPSHNFTKGGANSGIIHLGR